MAIVGAALVTTFKPNQSRAAAVPRRARQSSRMILDRFPSREAIAAHQLQQLRKLLQAVAAGNRFYAPRLQQAGLAGELRSLDDFFRNMPFTRKEEIAADQQAHPPYGTNLTFPLARLQPLHADQRHQRRAAPLARHAGKLAVDARQLEAGPGRRGSQAGRRPVLRLFLRAVPRLLDGVRSGLPDGLPLPARRRAEQPRPLASHPRQRGGRPLLHADLRRAPRPGRGRGTYRSGRAGRADDHRRRRAGRQRAHHPRTDRKGMAPGHGLRSSRHDGGRSRDLPVPGPALHADGHRVVVHRRDHRSAGGDQAGSPRGGRRIGPHHARPRRLAAVALSHGRPGAGEPRHRPARRPPRDGPAGRHPRPGRRHDPRPRREPLSGRRGEPHALAARGGRLPGRSGRPRARWSSCTSASSRPRPRATRPSLPPACNRSSGPRSISACRSRFARPGRCREGR